VTNRLTGSATNGTVTVLGTVVPLLPGSASSGDVTVLVRPEHLTVDLAAGGNASVVSASFLGANGRVIAAADNGDQVLVQVASGAVAGFAPGVRVKVAPTGDPALAVSSSP
ncbi:MAG: TOBE domain-containing protein, partial [Nostocoides sp.]